MTHISVGELITIGSDNGLSPGRRQAIIWTNAGKLLIRPLGTNFNEILIAIHKFPLRKMHLKTSSAKWRPFGLGLNVLSVHYCALKWPVRSHQPPWWAVCTQTPWVNKTFQGHVCPDTSSMAFYIASKSWTFITNGLSESSCGWALVVFL